MLAGRPNISLVETQSLLNALGDILRVSTLSKSIYGPRKWAVATTVLAIAAPEGAVLTISVCRKRNAGRQSPETKPQLHISFVQLWFATHMYMLTSLLLDGKEP